MSSYFVHPQALVETDAIGDGTRVWAFAHVMAGAQIGDHCNICDSVFVESNVVIGNHVTIKNGVSVWDGVSLADGVFVGPNAVFTNDLNPRAAVKKGRELFVPTLVEQGASIGANATIVCGTRVGRFAFIGAGAVIIRDVPDFAVMVGNPARQIGFMCECGERLDPKRECQCGLRFEKVDGGLRRIATPAAKV
jgi:UDP-2-acetamido-3-amino-2,3-dideoxy-glucuronate N-acetyltransferase